MQRDTSNNPGQPDERRLLGRPRSNALVQPDLNSWVLPLRSDDDRRPSWCPIDIVAYWNSVEGDQQDDHLEDTRQVGLQGGDDKGHSSLTESSQPEPPTESAEPKRQTESAQSEPQTESASLEEPIESTQAEREPENAEAEEPTESTQPRQQKHRPLSYFPEGATAFSVGRIELPEDTPAEQHDEPDATDEAAAAPQEQQQQQQQQPFRLQRHSVPASLLAGPLTPPLSPASNPSVPSSGGGRGSSPAPSLSGHSLRRPNAIQQPHGWSRWARISDAASPSQPDGNL